MLKDTCTPIFIAALFNSKARKKSTCPEEWVKKIWYIYTMKHYSAMKKKEIMPFAAMWIDLEGIMLSKIVRQILYDITYMWNLKKKNTIN